MQYEVTCSCGHNRNLTLFGKTSDRERKLKWYEEFGLCESCYGHKQNPKCDEVTMLYKDYKNNYPNCKTKANSYDRYDKTIVVYVPNGNEEELDEISKETAKEECIKELMKELYKIKAICDRQTAEILIEKGSQFLKETTYPEFYAKYAETALAILVKYGF